MSLSFHQMSVYIPHSGANSPAYSFSSKRYFVVTIQGFACDCCILEVCRQCCPSIAWLHHYSRQSQVSHINSGCASGHGHVRNTFQSPRSATQQLFVVRIGMNAPQISTLQPVPNSGLDVVEAKIFVCCLLFVEQCLQGNISSVYKNMIDLLQFEGRMYNKKNRKQVF